jgi:hypothetical protein
MAARTSALGLQVGEQSRGVAWLRQCYLAALDQRTTDGEFLSTGERGSYYAARDSFHFNGGSSRFATCLR